MRSKHLFLLLRTTLWTPLRMPTTRGTRYIQRAHMDSPTERSTDHCELSSSQRALCSAPHNTAVTMSPASWLIPTRLSHLDAQTRSQPSTCCYSGRRSTEEEEYLLPLRRGQQQSHVSFIKFHKAQHLFLVYHK